MGIEIVVGESFTENPANQLANIMVKYYCYHFRFVNCVRIIIIKLGKYDGFDYCIGYLDIKGIVAIDVNSLRSMAVLVGRAK